MCTPFISFLAPPCTIVPFIWHLHLPVLPLEMIEIACFLPFQVLESKIRVLKIACFECKKAKSTGSSSIFEFLFYFILLAQMVDQDWFSSNMLLDCWCLQGNPIVSLHYCCTNSPFKNRKYLNNSSSISAALLFTSKSSHDPHLKDLKPISETMLSAKKSYEIEN